MDIRNWATPNCYTAEKNFYFGQFLGPGFEQKIAAKFISAVVNSTPDDFPTVKARRRVVLHNTMERSYAQAQACKHRDKFRCQVCNFQFEKMYGERGRNFAEAHHKQPLSKLREGMKIRVEDLITVCANCHRMLHRMDARADDIQVLRKIVQRHQSR